MVLDTHNRYELPPSESCRRSGGRWKLSLTFKTQKQSKRSTMFHFSGIIPSPCSHQPIFVIPPSKASNIRTTWRVSANYPHQSFFQFSYCLSYRRRTLRLRPRECDRRPGRPGTIWPAFNVGARRPTYYAESGSENMTPASPPPRRLPASRHLVTTELELEA